MVARHPCKHATTAIAPPTPLTLAHHPRKHATQVTHASMIAARHISNSKILVSGDYDNIFNSAKDPYKVKKMTGS